MSKVISFSISDRYLDKIRSLYPSLTDNLAAKQFLTDRLDSSLDDSLDDSLDGILDDRLDAVVGKLITSLSERMARLESRLDDNLDGRLDAMEQLLKLQREASITSPIPTIEETSPMNDAGEGGNANTPEVSPSPPSPALDAIASIDGTVETVEPISTIETIEGMNAAQAYRYLAQKKVEVSERTLSNWVNCKKIPMTEKGDKVSEYLILRDKLYYPVN